MKPSAAFHLFAWVVDTGAVLAIKANPAPGGAALGLHAGAVATYFVGIARHALARVGLT